MPRTPSLVWIHFNSANVEGKAMYTCKYCAKRYVKNATKMQQHIAKCPMFSQGLNHPTPGKSSSASIRSEIDSDSDTFYSTPGHSGIGGFFGSVDERIQRNADECFARAMYATGSPLMLTDNVYWKRFLHFLCPAYTPPTSHALSTHLLDREFHRVQAKVKQTIDQADYISVISDGWSNVQGQGIISYIVTTPQPVFYKSTDIKDNRYTGPDIADELKAVIGDLGPEKIFALVTDNAANMKVAWALIEEAYPHITTIGCAAHALNLLLKDTMALNTMNTVYKTVKQVVKCVKDKHEASAIYLSKQKEKNRTTTLKLPSQCSGVIIMYHHLLDGKESLQEMATSQTVAIESDITRILMDDLFWERVNSSLTILKPIAAAIAKVEGENSTLSDVKCMFSDLREKLQTVLPTSLLPASEETAVVRSLEKHQEFCMKPIHAAAYMLDPKYEKSILTAEEINSAYSVISAMSHHLGLDEGEVFSSLAKYCTKQGLWEWDGIWQSCQHLSASTWWKGLCGSETLATVASIILQIPPTSAASERNWSLFRNTHTKLHSRLTNARVEKLVAIRANLRLFEPDTEPSSPRLDSDAEDIDQLDVKEEDMEDSYEIQEETIET